METKATEDNKVPVKELLSREEIFQRMREARARIVASGEKLLTWDEISDEIAANRSGRDSLKMKLETQPHEDNETITPKSLSRDDIIQNAGSSPKSAI